MRPVLKFFLVLAGPVFLAGCDDSASQPFRKDETHFRVVRQSLYNQIIVERDGDEATMVFRTGRNAPRQTAVDLKDPARLVIPYTRAMLAAALVQPAPRRILQIGLGGGGLNRYLRLAYPDTLLTTAELDGAVRDMAVAYMGFRPDGNDVVEIEDGRTFVRKNRETWDWILVDAFRDGVAPPHLKTREFYLLLKERLNPGGVIALNLHSGNKLYESDKATLLAVFPEAYLLPVPGTGNVIALAFNASAPDFAAAIEAAANGPKAASLRQYLSAAAPHLGRMAARPGVPILTDDYAPSEFLQQQATSP